MKVLNVVKDQRNDSDVWKTEHKPFLESFARFCTTKQIDEQIGALSSEERILLDEASKKIEEKLFDNNKKIESFLKTDSQKLAIYILIGCGKTDAFALAGAKSYIFFDVLTLLKQDRLSSIPDEFLMHELLHGYHLCTSSEFDPVNFKTSEDKLLKYFITEGVATYLTNIILESDRKSVFWGDFLNEEKFQNWRRFAERGRKIFSKRIGKYLANHMSEPLLISDLFYVLNMKDLEVKRGGYFYGYEIMDRFFKEYPVGLNFTYKQIKPHIKKYFEIG